MDKEKIIEYGILIASKELGIKPIDYAIDQEEVLKSKDLTGLYVPNEEILIFNSDWIEEANINDILLVVFHEMRHYYQHKQIDLLNKGINLNEDRLVVDRWKIEFDKYKSPFIDDQKAYLEQEVEKDAIMFSKELLNKVFKLI